MGLFNLLPLQIRATPPTTPPQPSPVPAPSAPPAPAAGQSGASPTPNPSPTPDRPSGPSTASPSPATPTPPVTSRASMSSTPSPSSSLSGDTSSVYITPFVGYGWRGFENNVEDTHEGFQLGFTLGYPTLQMGPNFSLRPEFLYRHEFLSRNIPADMGPAIRSSADIDVLGLGARLGWRPHPMFELSLAFNVGAAHLGSQASMDGHQGLRYHNNRLAYSADNWGFNVEGSLRAGLTEQRLLDWMSLGAGVQAIFGYAHWGLTPDAISRPTSDPEIDVDSLGGGLMVYLSGRFGSVGAAPRSDRSETTPQRGTPSQATTPVPQTPPSAQPEAPAAPAPTAPAASTPRVERLRFDVTPGPNGSVQAVGTPANFSTFFNGVAGADAVRQAMAQAGSTGFVLNLRVRYSHQTRGSLEVESIRIGDRTYQNGHFPADMAVSTTVIQNILQAVVQQGLPGYTGNRQQPLRVQMTYTPAVSPSASSTPTVVASAR